MDEPFNGGFICSRHKIGYKTKCPSCAFAERTTCQVCDRKLISERELYDKTCDECVREIERAMESGFVEWKPKD